MKSSSSRREFLVRSAVAAAPAVLAIDALSPSDAKAEASGPSVKPLSIVCLGAHPDDPESGCGGTLTRCAQIGHSVTVIYLTRGERGIRGKSDEEAARIRSAEAEAACQIMGAKPVFAGQVDGSTEFTRARLDHVMQLMTAADPDVIFTHWPVDTHFDHQVASLLAVRSHMALPKRPRLYFFEVNGGSQTQGFLPNTYVDITPCLAKKKEALFIHRSQDGEGVWREHHEIMARFRGREAGVTAAEGFVRLVRPSHAQATLDCFL